MNAATNNSQILDSDVQPGDKVWVTGKSGRFIVRAVFPRHIIVRREGNYSKGRAWSVSHGSYKFSERLTRDSWNDLERHMLDSMLNMVDFTNFRAPLRAHVACEIFDWFSPGFSKQNHTYMMGYLKDCVHSAHKSSGKTFSFSSL